jgi:integrase
MANLITFRGKTQSVAVWAREIGIPVGTLRNRLGKLGMAVEDALTRPVARKFAKGRQTQRKGIRPAPRLTQDSRGRGVARWSDGGRRRTRVFGPWDQPETDQAYARWAAEWYAAMGRPAPPAGEVLSVAGLVDRCLDWAEATYRKHDRPTSQVANYRRALGDLNELYGATAAKDFGPLQLRALRDRWVDAGLSLRTCQVYTRLVARAFSWAVGESLLPAVVADALEHVQPLAPGRTKARPRKPVRAAPQDSIDAALEFLDPVFATMVRVQLLTGMRPQDILELRAEELERTQTPWLYQPASGGKTLHLNKPRRIWIGPKARAVLEPWLEQAEPGQTLFRVPSRHATHLVPIRIEFYRAKLAEACQMAGVEVFRPNQLRHSRGTEVQRAYEDDAAVAAALGNTPETARQVYVDDPEMAVARRIAEELG